MQDHCNTNSTATAGNVSNRDNPSRHEERGELPRCQCCDAVIPSARQFALEVSATPISCIVCGHQNDLSPGADEELKAVIASPSGPPRKKEI
jgi:hypothetical protein